MLGYVTLIFACQLAGELFVAALGAPIPGPVAGMLILLIGLLARRSIPDELGAVGDFFLSHFSLLFIPAGVGVMLHIGLLGREWLPVTAALLISTLLTIAVTALAMRALSRADGSDQASETSGR